MCNYRIRQTFIPSEATLLVRSVYLCLFYYFIYNIYNYSKLIIVTPGYYEPPFIVNTTRIP